MFNNFCSNVIFFNKFCKGDNWRFLRRGSPSYNVPGKNHFVYLSCVNYSLSKAFQFADLTFTLGMTHFFPYQAYTLGMTQANGYVWFLPGWFKDRWYDIDYLRVRIIIFIEINCSFTLLLLSLQEKKKEDLASGQEVGDKVIV